jgi:ubiquinone/menaquinone biosynthesis C-methylase UbiE
MSQDRKDQSKLSWNPYNIFTGTAWYYARYRPSYPESVFSLLREKYHLNKRSRVLDLGCGTGQIALKLAPHVSEVVALDPQEEMLREGKSAAMSGSVSNITWLKGESNDLPSLTVQIGNINLTTIARAFHWMDREQTLNDLFKITEPGGGVAIIYDSGPIDGTILAWKEVIQQTVRKWLGEERKAGTEGTYSHPKKRFEVFLKESDFHNLETVNYTIERSWTIDRIIGYLYSTSLASLPVLGDKKESFEAELRGRLQEIKSTGRFKEPVTINVMMVWKGLPQPGSSSIDRDC